MGTPVTRVGDATTGHTIYPKVGSTTLASGASRSFINGKAIGRIGDKYKPHDYPNPHTGSIATGSANMIVEGSGAGRVGDIVSCGNGHFVNAGSPNTFN